MYKKMNMVYVKNYSGCPSCLFYFSYSPYILYGLEKFSSYLTSFSYSYIQNNSINYYVNDETGINVFDQDWSFIRKLNFKNSNYVLGGDMFIIDNYIFIGCGYGNGGGQLIKLDYELNIINAIFIDQMSSSSFSIGYDSCNEQILAMTVDSNQFEININVYNLYLRQISKINTISINSNLKSNYTRWHRMYIYNDKIYIFYADWINILSYVLVADINGKYINTYNFGCYYWVNSIAFDTLDNMIFTANGQIFLFDSISNNVTNNDLSPYDYFNYQYANTDQSGRLVVINPKYGKIKIYYNITENSTFSKTILNTSTKLLNVSSVTNNTTRLPSMFYLYFIL